MRNLTAILCLTLALLLGSAGVSWSADFQKGLDAAQSGDFATALREWKPLAKQGFALAQYALGVMYADGKGVSQDDKTAVKWFRLAAEQGLAGAQRQVEKLEKKIAEQKPSSEVTAEKPNSKLVRQKRLELARRTQKVLQVLGLYSGKLDGIIGVKTRSAIQGWQKRNGYPSTGEVTKAQLARLEQEAIIRLAEKKSNPTVTTPSSGDFRKGMDAYKKKDYATALREWRPLAEQGVADAQFNLGQMYYYGVGVPRDYKIAMKWYRLGAEQGDVFARRQIKILEKTVTAKKTPTSFSIAEEKRKKAAKAAKDAFQKGWRAYMHLEDYATALRHFKPLAEQGHADAQSILGRMYEEGLGVPQDFETARKWYGLAAKQRKKAAKAAKIAEEKRKKAAKIAREKREKAIRERGDAKAQFNLGEMYKYGKGVTQNSKTAEKWYRLAAEQGHADAQFNLGEMYQNGKGVTQNYKTAKNWYRLAAAQGNVDAQENLVSLTNEVAKRKREIREKVERIAREKREKVERIAREKRERAKRIAREKRIASNPGFRDLKPGLQHSEIRKFCPDAFLIGSSYKEEVICYGLQNLKFNGIFDHQNYLTLLTVNLGPIVGSGGFLNELATYMQKGETNIYLKMRNTLGEKYKLDFEYSERDRQLFNKDEKKKLYTVYEKGQVALLVTRKEKKYSHDLWLYIEYRDVKPAQDFFKSAKPKRAKKSDF